MAEAKRLRKLLGQRIRQLRKTRGWTQQNLADRAGLDWKYLGAVERGERNITLDNVEKIAAGFQVEAHHLFLFSAAPEKASDASLTEVKIRDLLAHSDPGRKKLMWSLVREVATWEGS